jgi:hypothetical protein
MAVVEDCPYTRADRHAKSAPAGTPSAGADPRRGTRLVCLADRVAAAGGTLLLTSPPGDGTAITTTLPLGLRAGARRCLGAERRALGPSAGS